LRLSLAYVSALGVLVLSDLDQGMATLAFETAMLVAMALEESLALLARWLARCFIDVVDVCVAS